MIGLEVKEARVFVRPGATDMRKQINGLALIVEQQMSLNPFEPALFLFRNGDRRILKAVYWDRTGFAMWQKRLEKHHFPWPQYSIGGAGFRTGREPSRVTSSSSLLRPLPLLSARSASPCGTLSFVYRKPSKVFV